MNLMETYSGKNRPHIIFRAAVSGQLSGQCQNAFPRGQTHVRKKCNKLKHLLAAEGKTKRPEALRFRVFLQRTVKIDIFVFGVKGSTAYKTGQSYWMPVSCAGLIFSSGKSFRHHTLSLSIKYETTSTYCFKKDLRNMRFPA